MTKDRRKVAMAMSLGITLLMLSGKLGAFFLTGSTAILSDAAESVIHIVATTIASFCLWYTLLPVSRTYPYGYGKIAYFSAGFEGALILMAALAILYTGVESLIKGPQLRQLSLGLAIIAALALVNLALGNFLVRVGRAQQTLILIAHGRHVLTDVWTSAGVVVGVALTWLTGLVWLDPVVAILMGLHIFKDALDLLQKAYDGLMEKANPKDTETLVKTLHNAVEKELIAGFHQLRYRRVNEEIWVEVHLLFPGKLTITAAHLNANIVESSIRELFPGNRVVVTSHLEPEDHSTAHPGGHINKDALE